MSIPIVFKHKSATAKLRIQSNETAAITSLYSEVRNQGHASELIKKILEYTDEHQLSVTLIAQQFGNPRGPNNEQLVHFYESFGFVRVENKSWNKILRREYLPHNDHSLRKD